MEIQTVRAKLEKIPALILSDAPLSTRTTLHIGGRPLLTVIAQSEEAFINATRIIQSHDLRPLFMGGGSNLLVADGDIDYVAIVLDFKEISIDGKVLTAQAGAVWDEVVETAIDAGLGGVECLSGIPGSAGAVPVQNVGAYGVEISDILSRVKLYNRETDEIYWQDASELDLRYRHSRLKFQDKEIVLAAEFILTKGGLSVPIRFGELSRALGAEGLERFDAQRVRKEVLRLRAAKGMVYEEKDHDTWSAGSFFTNPIVPLELAQKISSMVDGTVPNYPVEQEGYVKLSAAWLIDNADFNKGYPLFNGKPGAAASLSTKHTLALTNRGNATAQDILALAREIRAGVEAKFGVSLVPEPVFVGLDF
ncbi:MAG: UDP-N-acetylmuramate dehydrogenase [Corynebacterium sp.]|nr:UDP-N-acetylmuramate dehydrogenase [Corynebacterium sp.]